MHQWEGLTKREAIGPGGNYQIGKYLFGVDYPPMEVTSDCKMDNANVVTYDMQHQRTGGIIHQFVCPENTYKEINGGFSPLNDAHFFGTLVVDMYKDWFGDRPVPFKIRLNAHYWNLYYESFWDGTEVVFGDGYPLFSYPLAGVDFAAHEISHGFTEYNSDLIYEEQPGALNEAFSDMSAEAAKYYLNSAKPENERNNFLFAAGIYRPVEALRFFQDLTRDGRSIDNVANYNSNMDPHVSSGVYRKAFYTLATKESWNTKKAFEVFVLANQIYWNQSTGFDEGACGVARSALDLNYSSDDVIDAFAVVGINADCLGQPPEPVPVEILINGIPVNNIESPTGEELFWMITVPPGMPKLEIKISGGTGDADLYTIKDVLPTVCKWDCRPFLAGNDEICIYENPEPGNYFIMLNAFLGFSGVTLEGNY